MHYRSVVTVSVESERVGVEPTNPAGSRFIRPPGLPMPNRSTAKKEGA